MYFSLFLFIVGYRKRRPANGFTGLKKAVNDACFDAEIMEEIKDEQGNSEAGKDCHPDL